MISVGTKRKMNFQDDENNTKKQKTDELTEEQMLKIQENKKIAQQKIIERKINRYKSSIIDGLSEEWKMKLEEQFEQEYFNNLMLFLANESSRKTVYPPPNLIFNAFNLCPFNNIKIVILGQDPYHGNNQAMGLSFSVPPNIQVPPSLKNIFKELEENNVGFQTPNSGDLSSWSEQGVLLLNACFTVEAHKANSHQGQGWEQFSDAVIQTVAKENQHVVFLLWGKFAQTKANLIRGDHLILKSAHPSPFSADRFFGCKHFEKANQFLEQKGLGAVDWSL